MPKRRISRWRKAILKHPCGCYYCCGDVDKYLKLKNMSTQELEPKFNDLVNKHFWELI